MKIEETITIAGKSRKITYEYCACEFENMSNKEKRRVETIVAFAITIITWIGFIFVLGYLCDRSSKIFVGNIIFGSLVSFIPAFGIGWMLCFVFIGIYEFIMRIRSKRKAEKIFEQMRSEAIYCMSREI